MTVPWIHRYTCRTGLISLVRFHAQNFVVRIRERFLTPEGAWKCLYSVSVRFNSGMEATCFRNKEEKKLIWSQKLKGHWTRTNVHSKDIPKLLQNSWAFNTVLELAVLALTIIFYIVYSLEEIWKFQSFFYFPESTSINIQYSGILETPGMILITEDHIK